jgi:indolepyruvate ferredoxin oxidoreductase
MNFGAWMMSAFGFLARFKFLRGTPFDPFGYSAERRMERRLVRDYSTALDELLAGMKPENHRLAVEIASVPEKIRGFGPVKERHLTAAKAEEAALLARFRAGDTGDVRMPAAAE